MKKQRVAIYHCVSTTFGCQDDLIDELVDFTKSQNWTVVGIYRDEFVPGSKKRRERPGLGKLRARAAAKRFERVLCKDYCTFARSAFDFLNLIKFFYEKHHVNLTFLEDKFDTSSRKGMMIASLTNTIWKIVNIRILVSARKHDPYAAARRALIKQAWNRPSHFDPETIRALYREGKSEREIKTALGCSIVTVYRATYRLKHGIP